MSDNPSAFPTHDQTPTTDPRERILQGGMTLRDYFAGQALAGIGDWTPNRDDGTAPDWKSLPDIRLHRARWSYAQADAMLIARDGRDDPDVP